MFTMTYGRLVSMKSCHVIARTENLTDPYAVAIKRSGVIVGHIPRKI